MPEFGHSLALVDGDLGLRGGRVQTIDGIDNLVQALSLRLLTPLGSDFFNTGYGLDARNIFSQPAGTQLVKELVRLNVVRTLAGDPRVREVREVVIGEPRDRHKRSWPVDATVVTMSDESRTVGLEVAI
jgi:phage baseplate assembly protein W